MANSIKSNILSTITSVLTQNNMMGINITQDDIIEINQNNTFVYEVSNMPVSRSVREVIINGILENLFIDGYVFSKRGSVTISGNKLSSKVGVLSDDTKTYGLVLKTGTSSSEQVRKMKPKDIGIEGKRLTPNAIKDAVKNYLGEDSIIWNSVVSKSFDEFDRNLSTTFYGILEFGSEAIEIFSAYALLKRLSASPSLRKTIGVENIPGGVAKWTVYFPVGANFPLVDYFLVPPGVRDVQNNSIKVSVKNAAFGASPNTVKPKDLFSNVREINQWKKSKGQSNMGEYYTMLGGVTKGSSQASKTSGMYPLYSAAILAKSKESEFRRIVQYSLEHHRYSGNKNSAVNAIVNYFKNCDISKIKRASLSQNDDLSSLLKNRNSTTGQVVPQLVNILINTVVARSSKRDYMPDVGSLSLFFEKGFTKASEPNNMLNFKEMFYDRAIINEQVVYVTSKENVNRSRGSTRLYFDIMSKNNWSKLKGDWMKLRSKNNLGNLRDALGIDPRLWGRT
jgi:hypothetical protein